MKIIKFSIVIQFSKMNCHVFQNAGSLVVGFVLVWLGVFLQVDLGHAFLGLCF